MTRTLLAHHGEGSLGDVDDTEEVRLDLGAKVVVGEVLDGRGVAVAGVVHHDVERAEVVQRGLLE